MVAGEGKPRDIKKWMKQRAKRGFSDYDIFEINTWFLKIMPEMISELVKNNNGFPNFLKEKYLKDHNLDEFNLTEEQDSQLGEECLKEWTSILLEMEHAFYEARKETSSYKNKYQEEYSKARKEYLDKYGFHGEKIKNNPYIEYRPDGSCCISYEGNPYIFHRMDKYKEICALYRDEEMNIHKYRKEQTKKALDMFVKYFDELWW